MLAVKGACYSFRERLAAEVVGEHRCPRDALEQRPVATKRGGQRNNDQNFAESDQSKSI